MNDIKSKLVFHVKKQIIKLDAGIRSMNPFYIKMYISFQHLRMESTVIQDVIMNMSLVYILPSSPYCDETGERNNP
jgi:hypothetical protein